MSLDGRDIRQLQLGWYRRQVCCSPCCPTAVCHAGERWGGLSQALHGDRACQIGLGIVQMGLVSQEPTLFATTIRGNIALGKEGATDADIEAAARSANAHSFIAALPKG